MSANYRIAELCIRMEPQFEPLATRSLPYLSQSEQEADITIALNDEEFRFFEKKYPEAERGLIEYMMTGNLFYSALLKRNGLLLHASAVELDGRAYLFSAPSGTGKSTHTALWREHFGNRARIINDDKPAIRIQKDGIFVYGTPWSGKTDQNLNVKAPLCGIAFLERSKTNEIFPCKGTDVIKRLLEQTIRPAERSAVSLLMDHISTIVEKVPIYRLRCNISKDAVLTAFEAMNGGNR